MAICSEEDSPEISADELKSLYISENSGFIVIDVREPEEFQDWKIQGSTNVPLGDQFASRVKNVASDNQIITVCKTGVRSLYAINELEGAGLKAKSLRGGMVAWSNTYVTSEAPIPGVEGGRLLQVRRLSKGCTSYVIVQGHECIVVDPSSKIEAYENIANDHGFLITHVLDTHKHADHLSGARLLAAKTSAQLHLSRLDGYQFDDYVPLVERGKILLEEGAIAIQALHTPGHTPGSMSLLVNDCMLLSGDTLFLDSIGRPDLQGSPEQSAKQLYHTCQKLFKEIDDETIVLPAHFGPHEDLLTTTPVSASISVVKSAVPQINLNSSDAVKSLVCGLPKPANYETILRVNGGEDKFDPALVELLEEGHNRCALSSEAR